MFDFFFFLLLDDGAGAGAGAEAELDSGAYVVVEGNSIIHSEDGLPLD